MVQEKIATAVVRTEKEKISSILYDVHISYLQMHVKAEVTRFHIISTSP